MERENGRLTAAYVGRFAPLHIGHQIIIDSMMEKYGIENCLVIVGSSNSYTDRTPFTFEERREMINTIYPTLKVLPLPDIKPELKHFDGTTNRMWLDELSAIEKSLETKFVFYGGSKKDLEILATRFKTVMPVDRKENGLNISATKVREAIKAGDDKTLKAFVDPKILQFVIIGYNRFHEQGN